MARKDITDLLPFFLPQEIPLRATTPEDALYIHATMRRVDSAYERFRNLLDPGDEDLLRRKAILRFLERHWTHAEPHEEIALKLLKELAYGRYIPETTHRMYATAIGNVIAKARLVGAYDAVQHAKWFLPFIVVDIDRVLYPREADDALVYVFFHDVRAHVAWEDVAIADAEKDTQLFLACHRALAKTDDAELFWHLFRASEPRWDEETFLEETARDVGMHLNTKDATIGAALHHPLALTLIKKLEPAAVPYRLLRDILRKEDAAEILEGDERLSAAVQDVLSSRIARIERQMFRRAWHAAAFLFLSKGILAFLLEIPYELLVADIRLFSLLINLAFPPILLLLMAGSVKRPGTANKDQLTFRIRDICSGTQEHSPLIIQTPRSSPVRRSIFALTYLLMTILLFFLLGYVLYRLSFSLVGGFLFVTFLALVSFLGLRIRSSIRDVRVVTPRAGIISSLFDFFTLPIVDMGRHITLHGSRINIFLFILDAIIEAPFKLLLSLLEEWFSYIREKKEEVV